MNDNVFNWPTKELTIAFIRWLLIVITAFFAVYFSSNSYAASKIDHYHLYANWELSIPLVPFMVIVYMSYVLIFLVVLFVFKTPHAIKSLAYSMLVTTGVAGLIFVFFPGHLGYHRPEYVPGYNFLFEFLYVIDEPHNLFPSLHVTYATLCVMTMIHQTNKSWFHILLKTWFIIVCASVVLVHQHHLFDIASGCALAGIAYKMVFLKMVEKPERQQQQSIREGSYQSDTQL